MVGAYFALDTERGDFSSLGNERAGGEREKQEGVLCLLQHNTQAVVFVCVCVRMECEEVTGSRGMTGAVGSECDSFKESEHVNQK